MKNRCGMFVVRFFAVLVLFLSLAGCAAVTVVGAEKLNDQQLTPDAEPIAHIRTDNWGYYLFRYIPIVSGNLKRPTAIQWPVFFRNVVTEEKVVEALTRKSEELGADVTTDLRSRDRSEWIPYSLIFWLMEFEASGNASRLNPQPEAAGE